MMNKYNCWKVNCKCEPIPGTDRIIIGPSKRWILRQLAFEENVPYSHNDMIIKLPNGDMWCVQQISYCKN